MLLFVFLGAGCSFGQKTIGNDGGVLKTVNAGKDWVQSSAVPTAKGIGTLTTTNVINLEMDPSDSSVIYASTREDGFLYTDDSGISWHQPRSSSFSSGTVFDVQTDPKDVCTVYVAKGQRLNKTTDCMRTFDSEVYVESRSETNVTHIAIDWYDSRNIWIGLSNGDVLKSIDSGKTWMTVLRTGEEISNVLINNKDSRSVIVSLYRGGVQKTSDGGSTWNDSSPDQKKWKGSKQVYSVVQNQDGGAILLASQFGLLRSNDFGSTWEEVKLVTSSGQVQIRAVAFNPLNANTIYYATQGTFYKSVDGGVTWKTEKLPSTRIPRSIIVDHKDGNVIYIGFAKAIEKQI